MEIIKQFQIFCTNNHQSMKVQEVNLKRRPLILKKPIEHLKEVPAWLTIFIHCYTRYKILLQCFAVALQRTPSKNTLRHHIHESFTCLPLATCRLQNLLEFPTAKAPLDHNQLSKFLINYDVEMLLDLMDVIETMEIASVNISVNDSSLLDANQIMEFTFAKLNLISQLLEKECLTTCQKV